MPLEIPDLRTIRVYIELDLVEGEHFNGDQHIVGDETAREVAEASFVVTLAELLENGTLNDYVQSRIIEGGEK